MVIKWTNIHSGDTGYVERVDSKERHFVNTPVKENAKFYINRGLATIDLNRLHIYREDVNNTFEIED